MIFSNTLRSVVASSLLLTGSSIAKEATQNTWAAIMNSPTPHMVGTINSFNTGNCKLLRGQKIYIVPSIDLMPATDAFYTKLSDKNIATLKNAPNCKK